jgi:hypothetical protein
MIGLSLVIGFSAVLAPNVGENAWVLAPILLACVPLLFTPLGRTHAKTPAVERRPATPWQRDAKRRRDET